jgi:S1-C subfamily serine protease
VSKDGPAAKGGIKEGDLIVEIAGRPVTNVNTYMAVMSQQRASEPLAVTVMREGKKLQLKVVPQ